MAKEMELKYRATPQVLDAIQAAVPGAYTVIQMVTTYYDNPDGEFSRRKWTLRHRQENDRHICTLKTPAGSGERNEFEAEHAHIHAAIAQLAAESGILELPTLAENLHAVCGARFTRRALEIHRNGTTMELALDTGCLMGGGRELPFSEMEVELKAGDRTEVEHLAAELAEKFGLEEEPRSKFARARTLAEENHGI